MTERDRLGQGCFMPVFRLFHGRQSPANRMPSIVNKIGHMQGEKLQSNVVATGRRKGPEGPASISHAVVQSGRCD